MNRHALLLHMDCFYDCDVTKTKYIYNVGTVVVFGIYWSKHDSVDAMLLGILF